MVGQRQRLATFADKLREVVLVEVPEPGQVPEVSGRSIGAALASVRSTTPRRSAQRLTASSAS